MFLYKIEKYFSCVGFYISAVRCVEQVMFLFRCFLLLTVLIFAWYLSLCLYPDLFKASWYGVTESLKISSDEGIDESWDLREQKSLADRWWVVRFNVYAFYLIIFFLLRAISRIFEVECYI